MTNLLAYIQAHKPKFQIGDFVSTGSNSPLFVISGIHLDYERGGGYCYELSATGPQLVTDGPYTVALEAELTLLTKS